MTRCTCVKAAASVTAGLSATNIAVIDRAAAPLYPVAPRKTFDMIGGGRSAAYLGRHLLLAFAIESIDDRLQTSDEVENVAMLPSLAAIPHLANESDKHRRRPGEKQPELPPSLALTSPSN